MRSSSKRVLGVTAAATMVAGGMALATAGAAQAQSKPSDAFPTFSAPNSVKEKEEFLLRCRVPTKGWTTAKLYDKGHGQIAKRSMNGKSCAFRVKLDFEGTHKLRVKVISPQNFNKSKYLSVMVTPG